MKKRARTLTSFFTPALTPVTPLQPTGGTGASNNVAEQVAVEPTVQVEAGGNEGNTSQEQVISTQVAPTFGQVFDIVADPGLRKPIDEYDVNIRDAVRREYLLRGPCQPIGHRYPKKKMGDRQRSFQDSWFKNHDWLEYSIAKDAAFCFYCYLFKQQRHENFGLDAFTNKGFTNWKKAIACFVEHVGKVDSLHNRARRHCEDFRNQRQSVEHSIACGTKKQEEEYLDRITIMLGVVRFLLMQGLAFRGHDESSTSSNKGNFLECLDWFRKRNKEAQKVLGNAPLNHSLTSPKIQKELCEASAKETSKAILDDLGDKFFSILIDESRDVSIKEQMAIILRYVNTKGYVIERFLGICHVPDTTSFALKEALDSMLLSHGLSIQRVRGQGYDGASNMRGEFHGLQRRVLDENPYAFYIHCFAHQLQLVVVSVAKCCPSVTDFFNHTTMIVTTVNASCKRHDQLAQEHHDNLVHSLETGEISSGRGQNQATNLVRPGDTRWGSHHKTLCRLQLMWKAVLEVLENICEDGSSTQKTTADSLIKQMESFEFVFIMHLVIKLLGKTNDLSQCLQKKDQHIIRAIGLIGVTLQKINDIRSDGWEGLFEDVQLFCEQHNIIVPNMLDTTTVRGRSRGRGGQLITYHHHFKHEIFNVVLDQLVVELNNRFGERSTQLLRCIACLDPKNSFASFDIEKLIELAELYAADFSQYDCIVLKDQLDIFIADMRADLDCISCNDLGDLAVRMVQSARHSVFPLVYRLIELALVLPVATASVERAFSAMNIIKTELRNKTGDTWLNHRMVCYIEREIFASIEDDKILRHFQHMRTRKMQLPRRTGSEARNSSVNIMMLDEGGPSS